MVQDSIEKSAAFREGIQLVTPSMEWIKIDRDEDGFATEERLDMMFTSLPIVVAEEYPDGSFLYHAICDLNSLVGWRGEIDQDTDYVYYLPIPKLIV